MLHSNQVMLEKMDLTRMFPETPAQVYHSRALTHPQALTMISKEMVASTTFKIMKSFILHTVSKMKKTKSVTTTIGLKVTLRAISIIMQQEQEQMRMRMRWMSLQWMAANSCTHITNDFLRMVNSKKCAQRQIIRSPSNTHQIVTFSKTMFLMAEAAVLEWKKPRWIGPLLNYWCRAHRWRQVTSSAW